MNKNHGPKPFYVKVSHNEECFYIFTDEYNLSGEIKHEVAKIKELQPESIKLFLNKRV